MRPFAGWVAAAALALLAAPVTMAADDEKDPPLPTWPCPAMPTTEPAADLSEGSLPDPAPCGCNDPEPAVAPAQPVDTPDESLGALPETHYIAADQGGLIPADPCPDQPCSAGAHCQPTGTPTEPSGNWYVAPGGVVCPQEPKGR